MSSVPKRSNQKLKLLYIYKILLEQTDAQNGLTLSQISSELAKYDITAERKTLYDDIESLKLFGVDIAIKRDRHVHYYVATRELPIESLKLMADSVISSTLLSSKEKEQLLRRLVRLGGKSSASLLRTRETDQSGRERESREGIAVVCRAVTENKKIRCRSFLYNQQKQRILQDGGAKLTLSPWYVELSPNPRFVAYDRASKKMRLLYADRLLEPELLTTSREGESEYAELCASGELDSMLGHARQTMIRLRCSSSASDALIRKFGLDLTIIGNGEESFEASVRTSPDTELYSWIFSMAGQVEILSPESVANEYQSILSASNKK